MFFRILFLYLFSSLVFASDSKLLDALLKNGVINKTQYNELVKSNSNVKNDDLIAILQKNGAISKDQAASLTTNTVVLKNEPIKDNKSDSYVHMNEKGLEFGSADGNFKSKIGGRIQVDSQVNWNNPGAPANTQLANGVGIRRARLYNEGVFYHDYEYRFEYDFVRNGGGAAGITDAYVKYIKFAPFALTIGQQNESKSMESTMSNNYLTFIERSLPNNAFIEQSSNSKYQLGIMGETFDKVWGVPYVLKGGLTTQSIASPGFSNSATGPSASGASTATCSSSSNWNGTGNDYNCTSNNQNSYSGNMSYQLTGRGVILPYKDEEGNLLHTGIWGSGRSLTNTFNSNGSLRNGGWQFASQPDTTVDRTNFVNTGNLTGGIVTKVNGKYHYQRIANNIDMFGAELLGAWGPFHTSSEFMMANVSGQGYSGGNTINGFYTSLGWFITGETRPYDEKKGTWNRVIPNSNFLGSSGGTGAIELAARYDLIDMNTHNINGGAMDIGTLGLNWYLTPRIRVMTNWVHVFAVNQTATSVKNAGLGCKTTAEPATGGNYGSAPVGCFNGVTPNVLETAVRVDF